MRCWNCSSECAWLVAISIYITTVTKQVDSRFLFSVLRVESSVMAKARSAVHTDHMKAGLGCLCIVLAPIHMEWGLKKVHKIWVLTCWKSFVQVFRFCVSELTGVHERYIKFWGMRWLFCVSGWSIAHISVPLTQILLVIWVLLFFSVPSLQSSHLYKGRKGSFPTHWVMCSSMTHAQFLL